MFVHYQEANRPALREMAQWIKDHADARNLRGTASSETIRRVMTGAVVPRNWLTVEVILEALCGIADRSTDEERWEDNYRYDRDEPSTSFKEEHETSVEQRTRPWGRELAPAPHSPHPRGSFSPSPAAPTSGFGGRDDPWSTPARTGFGAFNEDPPF